MATSLRAEACGGENWSRGARMSVCVCVLGVWGGDTQRKAPWLCSRRSSELLRSPAASCCVFVSAKTSKPITNVVHYTRVSVCVCVSRCAAVKIIQPSWEASWELHTPLFVCSVCLPRHKSSAAVLFFWGGGGAFPPPSDCFSLVSLLPPSLCASVCFRRWPGLAPPHQLRLISWLSPRLFLKD